MRVQIHSLGETSLGTRREVTSFHYGQGGGRKAYIQAALHADELPGMLVAHHLRCRLAALEAAGQLKAEVVVVPVANPIGLAQAVLRNAIGRFELVSGENFNRHYPALLTTLMPLLEGRLGADAQANTQVIRTALPAAVAQQPQLNELDSLRKTVLGLACDAELVLDLHCDCEAVVHLYTAPPLWPQTEPLARLLGAQASLLATESGDQPFDEACSQTWWQLQAVFKDRYPVEPGCLSMTVELRGEADVNHPQAIADADALIGFLIHRGMVAGEPPVLPPLQQPATPLSGVEIISTPVAGVVVYSMEPGAWVRAGDTVAEIVNPLSGEVSVLKSRTEGVLFAREYRRYAPAGRPLCKVAGRVPLRSGKLLTA